MRTLNDRYHNDPVFHQLVDTMYSMIVNLKTTPTEIREAAMFAQLKFEMENPRPITISEDLLKQLLENTKIESGFFKK